MNKERIIEIKRGETVVIKYSEPTKELLSFNEFAKQEGISRSTLYLRIKQGKIKPTIDEFGKKKININQLTF